MNLVMISQYFTAEALEELRNSLTETIELSLHKLFKSLKSEYYFLRPVLRAAIWPTFLPGGAFLLIVVGL